jgi:hypothetical protein
MSHDGNGNKATCASAQHFNVALHNGGNDKPCAQAHDIYTPRHTTAMTTRPCAQAHIIFNIMSHDGNDDKASCASARHLYVALYNRNND